MGQTLSANWDDWDEIIADWDDIIPVTPCHWDDALDESIEINEAVYFTT